ncbi:hypothetical protein V1477_005333, partial [Vespula maculifrons]
VFRNSLSCLKELDRRTRHYFDFLAEITSLKVLVHCEHKDRYQSLGLRKQQPPRGETWVGIACDISKSKSRLYNASTTGRMAAYFRNKNL